ncbi:bifunctional epoxide hydrolase 2 isoform X2 [Tyto alba]|uniref:bifunctional epoxide hydrolase 2 isoform X2 n=1 Tax=Tyto alba TaxID=56313 RepID=UPI001C68062B|nr:bifunctional epoxide hydrolase 2 isoform X2 [Tyto alba]
MVRRAVLFDLGGVLFGPGLQHFLGSCERDCALPRNFLRKVMFAGNSDSPYTKVMRGQITLSQLFSEMEEGCRQHASASGITLPPTFSVARAFEEMGAKGTVNAPLLRAARVLRRNGFKTCVLTNNWVDDSAGRLFTAVLMNLLRRHFDLMIESCRLGVQKPDPQIYTYALDALQAKPHEVILLDDVGENLKPAREMGMATVLVGDTETALKELEELSGIQLLTQEEPLPTACDPSDVTHGYVPIRPGVQLHFVEMGHGPVVCLCHGFPESWLSWRYQIPALADAGFRVIALEMKGYGESTAPPDVKEYSQEQICKDLAVFLDKLGIPQSVLVGHDWGGAVVWNMALFYPERSRGLAEHPVSTRQPRCGHRGEDENLPQLRLPVLLPGTGRRGSGAREGHRPDPEGSPALCAQLPQGPGARGAAGGLPRKPTRQPAPARPRAAILHPALREIRLQRPPELVPQHATQLALGALRQGQEDHDAGADGHGREGRGAASQYEQRHGGVDPAAAPGAHRGVRALDADGEAGGAQQDPAGVAGGAPPRHPPPQDLQAVSGAGRQSPVPCLSSSLGCFLPLGLDLYLSLGLDFCL